MIQIKQKKADIETVLPGHSNSYAYVKRIFDLSASCLLLIILSPLFLLISFVLYLDDGSPILFRQIRVGEYGRTFTIWKFRTMPVKQPGEKKLEQDRAGWINGVPDNFVFKSQDPQGISFIGKLLRKYSLDELPQLINVIEGSMSLVGPRPEVPEIVRYYNQDQSIRLTVKPGITGYAQVNGRSHLNHGQKITYDKYYVENCSWKMDLKILMKTVIKIISTSDNY